MKIGYALRDITPDRPYPMSGFDLRQECAEGVHDPLAVRVLAVEEDAGGKIQRKLLINYDLLGISMDMTDQVIGKMEEELGLTRSEVQVCATHTHAAPKSIFSSFACYDPEYRERIASLAAQAAKEAFDDMKEAKAVLHTGTVEGVASFRDSVREMSHFDMPCDAIWFDVEGAEPVLLLTYHTHPTVMNEKNMLNSRDLVYGCDKALHEALPNARTIFFNGACGDISTRYTRLESSFEEVDRLGKVWADKVLSMLKEEGIALSESYQVCRGEALFVPPAAFFDDETRKDVLAYLEKKIEDCQDTEQKREYISCRSVLLREFYGKNRDGSPKDGEEVWISIMSLGPALMVFLPFEYSQRQAANLKAEVKKKLERLPGGEKMIVEIIGYSNGYEGYLPSGRKLDKDSGYMDIGSSFHSESSRLLADKVLSMMDEV